MTNSKRLRNKWKMLKRVRYNRVKRKLKLKWKESKMPLPPKEELDHIKRVILIASVIIAGVLVALSL